MNPEGTAGGGGCQCRSRRRWECARCCDLSLESRERIRRHHAPQLANLPFRRIAYNYHTSTVGDLLRRGWMQRNQCVAGRNRAQRAIRSLLPRLTCASPYARYAKLARADDRQAAYSHSQQAGRRGRWPNQRPGRHPRTRLVATCSSRLNSSAMGTHPPTAPRPSRAKRRPKVVLLESFRGYWSPCGALPRGGAGSAHRRRPLGRRGNHAAAMHLCRPWGPSWRTIGRAGRLCGWVSRLLSLWGS